MIIYVSIYTHICEYDMYKIMYMYTDVHMNT